MAENRDSSQPIKSHGVTSEPLKPILRKASNTPAGSQGGVGVHWQNEKKLKWGNEEHNSFRSINSAQSCDSVYSQSVSINSTDESKLSLEGVRRIRSSRLFSRSSKLTDSVRTLEKIYSQKILSSFNEVDELDNIEEVSKDGKSENSSSESEEDNDDDDNALAEWGMTELVVNENRRRSHTVVRKVAVAEFDSMETITHDDFMKNSEYLLHDECSRPTLHLEELERLLIEEPEAPFATHDDIYPIHLLAENYDTYNRGDEFLDFCLKLSIVNPDALLHKEHVTDKYPLLLKPVADWLLNVYRVPKKQRKHMRKQQESIGSWEKRMFTTRKGNRDTIGGTEIEKAHAYNIEFVASQVDWLLTFISGAMDYEISVSYKHTKLVRVLSAIRDMFAGMPGFLKTLFLIEDRYNRNRIISLTLVKQIMLQAESASTWLPHMLANPDRKYPKRAISYFEKLSGQIFEIESDPSSSDSSLKSTRSPNVLAHDFKKMKLVRALRNLPGLFAAINSLTFDLREQAVDIRLVQYIIDDSYQDDFTITLITIDLLMMLTSLIAFNSSAWFLIVRNDQVAFHASTIISVWCCCYFLIRKVLQINSFGISFIVFYKNILMNNWIMIESIEIILSSITVIQMLSQSEELYEFNKEPGYVLLILISAVLLLQMARIVGFLRMFNDSFAVFILTVTRTFVDLKWFLVVLTGFMFAFGQIFLFAIPIAQDLDAINETKDCWNWGDKVDTDHVHRQCGVSNFYALTYEMMLGELHTETFTGNFLTYSLFILYTFSVTILLLNILIAIASYSFEEMKEKGPGMFRVERLALSAQMTSAKKLFSTQYLNFRSVSLAVSTVVFYFGSLGITIHFRGGEHQHDEPFITTVFFYWAPFVIIFILGGLLFAAQDGDVQDAKVSFLFRNKFFSRLFLLQVQGLKALNVQYFWKPIEQEETDYDVSTDPLIKQNLQLMEEITTIKDLNDGLKEEVRDLKEGMREVLTILDTLKQKAER